MKKTIGLLFFVAVMFLTSCVNPETQSTTKTSETTWIISTIQ